MTSLKPFELQQQIKENSHGLAKTMSDLHKWEKEIKRTSAANCQAKTSSARDDENSYSIPIRSHNGHAKPISAADEPQPIEQNSNDVQLDANSFKALGNKFVQSNDYASAIEHYTKAIEIREDAVFYSNRALCHLKLEQYTKCIDDCTKAVLLDGKLIKGFYRRMQANEVLGNFDMALKDCKEVLKLDAKNADAIQASQRLKDRIAGKNLSQPASNANVLTWSKLGTAVRDVTFIKKPPHLRSKKPLRRIQINEPLPTNSCPVVTPPSSDKKSKDEENEAFKSADVAVGAATASVATTTLTAVHQSDHTCNESDDNKMDAMIPSKSPNSSAQFYRTWRELRDESQKYSYLKIIEVTAFSKLLGPQFNSEMLKDLLKILSENYIRDNQPVTGILKQIVVNDEFKILKMFMDSEDKNAFEKLLKYMESNAATDFEFIKDKYFN